MRLSTRLRAFALCTALLALAAPAFAQNSRGGSKAASALATGGSGLVAAGSTEILESGAELVVTSAKATANGVSFVVEPVADATSAAAATSKAVTIELSQAAWERAASALETSGDVAVATSELIAEAIEVVAVNGSELTHEDLSAAASAGPKELSVMGLALVIQDVVIGLLPDPELAKMLGHAVHQ